MPQFLLGAVSVSADRVSSVRSASYFCFHQSRFRFVFSGFKGWIIFLDRNYTQRNRFRIPQRNYTATFSASIIKTSSDANARETKYSKMFLKTKKQADS